MIRDWAIKTFQNQFQETQGPVEGRFQIVGFLRNEGCQVNIGGDS